MKNLFKLKEKGFTLIELLVVIAIIGILAAIVLVSLNSARERARDARRLSDVTEMQNALELFYNDNSRYPLPATASATGPTPADGSPAWSTYTSNWPITQLPVDGTCTAANNVPTYTQLSSGASYTLTFCLGVATGGYAAGTLTASPTGITAP